MDENSFPIYKRRDPDNGGSSFVNSQGLVVTNQWVVTYNKTILLLWHITGTSAAESVKEVFSQLRGVGSALWFEFAFHLKVAENR